MNSWWGTLAALAVGWSLGWICKWLKRVYLDHKKANAEIMVMRYDVGRCKERLEIAEGAIFSLREGEGKPLKDILNQGQGSRGM